MPNRIRFDKRKEKQKKMAVLHITELGEEAAKCFAKDPERSNKYAEKICKTQMKYKVKIPREIKYKICKKCHKFLVPGRNCSVRTNKGNIVYSCFECKGIMKIGYKRKKVKNT